jgi:putative SOS response-associated peptidase YedK
MCYNFTQKQDKDKVEARFTAKQKRKMEKDKKHDAVFNGFTYPLTPVIINTNTAEIDLFSWGFLPSWSQDLDFRKNTLNAKIETLNVKPSFKNYLNQRCLIIADSFMEWQWLDSKGKLKQQYEIVLNNGNIFAFAGLYNIWKDKKTGEIINNYTIITTEANPLMAEIHNTKKRMPVILTPENEKDWLLGKPILEFAKPEINLKANKIVESNLLTLF